MKQSFSEHVDLIVAKALTSCFSKAKAHSFAASTRPQPLDSLFKEI
jgi:hypothetical protein